MGNQSKNIKMLIQKLAGTFGTAKVKLMDVTVRTVDKDNNTCIVDSLDGTHDVDGLKVRLALEVCDGNLEYPEENSTITIAFTDFTEPYMVVATWLTEKDITIGNQCWNIKDKKQYFNSDKFGGIPIVKDPDDNTAGLLARINKLEDILKDLIQKYNLHTHPYVNVSAPATTSATTSLENAVVVKTTEKMISNPSIFHGKKIEH